MATVTNFEFAVLTALAKNDFNGGQLDGEVWANCIEDYMPANGPKGKQISAVVSSLSQKGLVRTNGASGRDGTVCMTPAGVAAYQAGA